MFASFWLGLAIFGIFEMGNCFTDPFGDDPADLGVSHAHVHVHAHVHAHVCAYTTIC